MRTRSKSKKNLPYDQRLVADEIYNLKQYARRRTEYEITCFTEEQAELLEQQIPMKIKGWSATWHYDLIDKVYKVKCMKEEKE